MKGVSVRCGSSTEIPNFASAYATDPVIPIRGSVSVPSRSNRTVWRAAILSAISRGIPHSTARMPRPDRRLP